MDVYKLLKLNNKIKSHRIKFLALFGLHILNKRYLALNLDPVMACNLRCKMCYFTDKDYVKKLKGIMNPEQLERIAKTSFKRALKLQIGCGTEPTLYKDLPAIVRLGKKYSVPYISLTTNANLLNDSKIEDLLKAGLNEFTISLHGVTKESYESFMEKGNYEKFQEVFNSFSKFKLKYNFRVRVNYTINKDNFTELKDFLRYFNPNSLDILQLRPIKSMGNTTYSDLNLDAISSSYETFIGDFKKECSNHNITLLAPNTLAKNASSNNLSSVILNYTFCYISPNFFWRNDFDWKNETFNEYARRTNWSTALLKNVFKSKKQLSFKNERLNYEVQLG